VGNDGELAVTDLATGSVIHRQKVHEGWATAVAASASGDRIVTGGRDHRVRVWDTATWKQVAELTGHTELVWGLVITADGRTIASVGDDGKALLFPIQGGEPRVLEGHHGPVYCISASKDGTRLLTGGFDNTVRLWDTASGSELLTLRGHTSAVWSAVFSPEGDSILSTSDNGTIRLWRSTGPGNIR
jgi:WD40 repeat protein